MALSSQTNKIIPASWIYCVLFEEISEVEKNRSRRLYISIQKPAAKRGGGWRSGALPPHCQTFYFKDDVTIILPIGYFFHGVPPPTYGIVKFSGFLASANNQVSRVLSRVGVLIHQPWFFVNVVDFSCCLQNQIIPHSWMLYGLGKGNCTFPIFIPILGSSCSFTNQFCRSYFLLTKQIILFP